MLKVPFLTPELTVVLFPLQPKELYGDERMGRVSGFAAGAGLWIGSHEPKVAEHHRPRPEGGRLRRQLRDRPRRMRHQ